MVVGLVLVFRGYFMDLSLVQERATKEPERLQISVGAADN